ncbi:hypothetical protein CORC01_10090 [Colletotrichum orchidophilum]|uniref:Uncharacterized protein n=1 Tax=Colletotrichum orchidophilum TaxID=1209926 RepID=A0A1G4AZT3_9PEZI|nr:uncharacterized protein CORC01_10090 [Colletotrichum orchidophilum]OHE94562.1 hypothetical protein CORC01_10090 [Colletotrichum orchidophilum]
MRERIAIRSPEIVTGARVHPGTLGGRSSQSQNEGFFYDLTGRLGHVKAGFKLQGTKDVRGRGSGWTVGWVDEDKECLVGIVDEHRHPALALALAALPCPSPVSSSSFPSSVESSGSLPAAPGSPAALAYVHVHRIRQIGSQTVGWLAGIRSRQTSGEQASISGTGRTCLFSFRCPEATPEHCQLCTASGPRSAANSPDFTCGHCPRGELTSCEWMRCQTAPCFGLRGQESQCVSLLPFRIPAGHASLASSVMKVAPPSLADPWR